jgi:hypothetical protein
LITSINRQISKLLSLPRHIFLDLRLLFNSVDKIYEVTLCNTVIPVLRDQEKIWSVKTSGLSQEVSYSE